MVTLNIDNSYSQIEGLSLTQHKHLAKILSYSVGSFHQTYGPKQVSLLTKKGSFPTGLLYLVQAYLRLHFQDKKSFNIIDHRVAPKPIEGLFNLALGYTPYPEQQNAALACLKNSRGIVVAPTGSGKSLIAALIIQAVQVPTLIIVPSLELKRQLTKSMKEWFGDHKVGRNKDICIENCSSVKCTRIYDCVIIDEFHHSGAKTYRNINKKQLTRTYLRFGLTATPFRSQENERLLLESVLSNVIYRISYQDAVNQSRIVPMEVYYYELPKIKTDKTSWKGVYDELVIDNSARNSLITDLLRSLKAAGRSTLCLVKEIRHGNHLSDASQVHFANGVSEDTPDLIKFFSEGKLNSLIGTEGVLGEGVDTKPAEYIILAGLGKSRNRLMQAFGRGFRNWPGKESCKIILFYDPSHKWTRDHFRTQVKILEEEYGVTAVRLD